MASKKANVQVLGLPRTQSDSAFIFSNKQFFPYGKVGTGQDAVVLALAYLHHFGVTQSQLEDKYHLRKGTLQRVKRGEHLTNRHDDWLHTLARALNDLRLAAMRKGEAQLVADLRFALSEILLAECGVCADWELVDEARLMQQDAWRKKALREGYNVV